MSEKWMSAAGWAAFAGIVIGLSAQGMPASRKRLITVADTIATTSWVNERYFEGGNPDAPVAVYSPDRREFVILVDKGNLEQNTNDYSILLFRTQAVLESPKAETLLTVSSSTNRPGIRTLRWLTDDALVFIEARRGEVPQVVRLAVSTRREEKLTDSPTPVEAFDMSHDGRQIVFEADPPPHLHLDSAEVQRHGLVVEDVDPLSVLAGEATVDQGDESADRELFVQSVGARARRIPAVDFLSETLPLSMSPSGSYAIVGVYVRNIPHTWYAYKDEMLHPYLVEKRKPGSLSNVDQYMLLDTRSGRLAPVFDAPKSWYYGGVAWGKDDQSVILSGAYLPLAVPSSAEREIRERHPFVVEVSLATRAITEITDASLAIRRWDQRSGRLILNSPYAWAKAAPEAYQKSGPEWRAVPLRSSDLAEDVPIAVTLEEDMNHPPRIFAARPGQSRTLLLDLNPQYAHFELGEVEAITWKATDGHEVRGGLYLPPGYTSGHRYPLVIQTHGFRPDRFWVNGPWNSAFAAQPLAAAGMVVLQVGNSPDPAEDLRVANTPEECPRQMSAYEGAIDYLDRRGLIDRDRVGIIGFSRTVLHVVYTLTHSQYHFEAATLADGFDGGYMGYMLWGGADYPAVNGGFPAGATMQSWVRNSAGFNLDKIRTPVRLEYYGRWGVLGGWSLYSGLSLLEKPADFLWLPYGTHLLVRPWDRLASQQGDVDWFRFWLQGHEDRVPEKRAEYVRWNRLRAMSRAQPEAKGGKNHFPDGE